jgi:hypothetical protein
MRRSPRVRALVAVLILALGATIPAAAQPPAATRVVTYRPAVPSGAREAGQCWTTSIATNRPDAYRCLRGNEIFDPCFAARPNLVVCDAMPPLDRRGFALALTRPLPKATPLPGPVAPWIVQLADGNVCTPYTGTRPLVNGHIIAYGCEKRDARVSDNGPWTGLVEGTMTQGRVWRVLKGVYSDARGTAQGSFTTAVVAAVWR